MIKLIIHTTAFLFLLALCTNTNGQTLDKANEQLVLNDKPAVTSKKIITEHTRPTDPFDALRNGKLIFVKSSSLLVGVSVIEEKLLRRPEFQQLGLMITRDESAADIILEVHHDRFTKYVYNAVDPRQNLMVAGGKLSSLGGTVASKVAERFLKQVIRVRQSKP